jgi:hypothetical protein
MRIRRIIFLLLFCLYIAAVAYLCFARPDEVPSLPETWFGLPADKVAHFLMFLPFPFLGYIAFEGNGMNWWKKALLMTEPNATYKLEPIEDMNIQNGLMQLTETWSNPQLMYDSMSSGIEDYDDIFRTKGYMKKTLRNLAEHRNATLEEHSKRNYDRE